MKRIELTRLLRENNYDYGFINKIIKNTFSDLKNFDLNLEIIKILLEQKIKITDFVVKIFDFLFLNYEKIKFENISLEIKIKLFIFSLEN